MVSSVSRFSETFKGLFAGDGGSFGFGLFRAYVRRSLTSESEKEKRGRRCPCGSPVAGDRETIADTFRELTPRYAETRSWIVCFRYDVIS